MSVSLRPATAADETFLSEVYSSTRRDELASWGWDAAQRDSFLTMQFNAQQAHFRNQFPGADHSIVLVDGKAMGRMVVVRMVLFSWQSSYNNKAKIPFSLVHANTTLWVFRTDIGNVNNLLTGRGGLNYH